MSDFRNCVHQTVAAIPAGKLMTYGQIAAICGKPRAARVVGQIAHYGPEDLPWHRVVRQDGGLASGFWGGMAAQAKLLQAEDIVIKDLRITNLSTYLYWPPI